MHILPLNDPRGPNPQDGHDVTRDSDGARHFHYHAGGDAEERIRREAVRDYLYQRAMHRDGSYLRLGFTIIGVVAVVFVVVGLVALLTPSTTTRASRNKDAVEVTTELRDGKWVATAKQVPAAEDQAMPEIEDENPEEAPSQEVPMAPAIDNSQLLPKATTAYRRCQGQWVGTEGMVANVQGRQATLWFKYEVQDGDTKGQTKVGRPVSAGLSFNNDQGLPSVVLTCEADRMLVTMLQLDNANTLLTRTGPDELASTLAAWENGQ